MVSFVQFVFSEDLVADLLSQRPIEFIFEAFYWCITVEASLLEVFEFFFEVLDYFAAEFFDGVVPVGSVPVFLRVCFVVSDFV